MYEITDFVHFGDELSVHKEFIKINWKLLDAMKSHAVIAHHPFIVQLFFAFQNTSKFYLGLEYVPGGELFYHLTKRGTFPINEVRL